ncbi:MAG: hypothetical protein AAF918_13020 [Pseudomonadota bacterium]
MSGALGVMRRFVLGVLLASSAAIAAADFAGEYESEDVGQIERIELSTNTAIIGGLSYVMDPGVRVEINNSYGAFSMLQPGMFVRIYFNELSATDRRAVFIEHLTNSAEWEET